MILALAFDYFKNWAVFDCILTSTKNASIIIAGFLERVYKNKKPRNAYPCDVGRGWNVTRYSDEIIHVQRTHGSSFH